MSWSNLKFLIIPLVFLGCQSEETERDLSDLGLNYYPVDTGFYRVYDVNAIQYNFNVPPDTIKYQLKEVFSEEFENLEGGNSYKLERFKRENVQGDWKIDSVWTVRKNSYNVIVTEGNNPYIKLSFPLEEEKTWDGNALFADTSSFNNFDEYQMIDVYEPYKIFDSTEVRSVTVVQEETTDNLLFRNIRKEIFADGIGLLHKEYTLLNFCADADCIGQDIIETGLDYKQELIEYGVE